MGKETTWKDYLDTQLIGTGEVNQAFMLGITDAQVWANTEAFLPRCHKAMVMQDDGTEKEQVINEAEGMLHIAEKLKKPASGLYINGVKYMPVRTYPNGSADDGMATIYFKKPKLGGCICILHQAILVGTYDEKKNHSAASCNFNVETLGRYLYSNGF